MSPDETAPPFERWEDRLKNIGDRELTQMARDYRWLDEEARVKDESEDFRRRREAIRAECRRRGMSLAA